MRRFTLVIPEILAGWLDEQADVCQRSRNEQIHFLLVQARLSQARRQFAVFTGSDGECNGRWHYFVVDVPMEGDKCNCGKVRW